MKRLAGGAVLDASVGVKLVVAEAGHERARELLAPPVRRAFDVVLLAELRDHEA